MAKEGEDATAEGAVCKREEKLDGIVFFVCNRRAWDGHPEAHAQPPPTTQLPDRSSNFRTAQAGCIVSSFRVLRTEVLKSSE